MAYISGLSFSGLDHLNTIFELGATGWSNDYFSKKSEKRALANAQALAKYQYELQLQSLKDSPSAAREGLEIAGYNPMLALGSSMPHPFSGSTPYSPSSAHVSMTSGSGAVGSPFMIASAKEGLKLQKEQVRAARASADVAESDAKTKVLANKITRLLDDAKLDALQDGSAHNLTVGLSKMQTLIRDTISNEFELTAKEKSALNTKEGLQAILHEKLGKQAQSPLGKAIYDFLGDFMLPDSAKK